MGKLWEIVQGKYSAKTAAVLIGCCEGIKGEEIFFTYLTGMIQLWEKPGSPP